MLKAVVLKLETLPWTDDSRTLAHREHKVLSAKLSGKTPKKIASESGKSRKTAETQQDDALRKLHQAGIENRGLTFLYLDLLIRGALFDPELKAKRKTHKLETRESEILMLYMLGYPLKEMPDYLANTTKVDLPKIRANLKRQFKADIDVRKPLLARKALLSGAINLSKLKQANEWRLQGKHPLTGKDEHNAVMGDLAISLNPPLTQEG